ncbi:MAG TPA: ADP-glyceromanno-heptose 6-epimerase [Candidatus Baltobacteraceae bacterium]|jgi:ADP-L-glycero-D-manno-heptose 6-epimerase|nr:ADP-glyceromanno-heptose 6-epimerase [Candidatus Baltobacteraceae bacterium]
MHQLNQGRIVVTGGAGFIGSALVWALNLRGIDNILVVDRLDTTEKWKNLVPLRYRDYQDADDFLALVQANAPALAGISTILHLGACSSTTENDAAYLMRNNYEYTKQLARWSVTQGVRFVYASSAATYGGLERDLRDDGDLDALRPLNMYAYSKHRFDLYARDEGLLDRITGLKYFNIFGPNEHHKGDMRSLVDKAFYQIRENGGIRLFKSHRCEYRDGEQQRDFLYVKDAVAMTLHLAQSEAYGLYNVGAGAPHTWLDLVRPIFRAMDVPERIEFIDMPVTLRDKYQYCTCATIDRLRRAGYAAPITPLADAVDDYVRNYLIPDRRLDPQASMSGAVN